MRVNTLTRYLLLRNLFLMLLCLGVGTGIYLLSDLFDRLDDFLEAGLGIGAIVTYFAVKTPLIISQILPAVFLIAVVLQLSSMAARRELVALEAGGVPLSALFRFLVLYGLIWCGVQLVFSQAVGAAGETTARRIWKEDVKKQAGLGAELHDIWFTEGSYVVSMRLVRPNAGTGEGINAYLLGPERRSLKELVRAQTFEVKDNQWTLHDVRIFDPEGFRLESKPSLVLPLKQELESFLVMRSGVNPSSLPLWRLGSVINELKASGSNVEGLQAAWHMKLAYAFSVPILGLVALLLVTWRENVYLNIAAGMAVAFAYYVALVMGVTAGEKGVLPPLVGAWLPNVGFAVLTLAGLYAKLWPKTWRGR